MNLNEVVDAGFEPIRRCPRRLIASIQSIKKSEGKTRLSFTAPKPIGYISVEIGGEEGVADGFIPTGQDTFDGIRIARVRMAEPEYVDPTKFDFSRKESVKLYDEAVALSVQNAAQPAMYAFEKAYYASLANMRTTVVDTGTDLYALARLADFGRLEKIPQLAYTQVKRQFAKYLDDAFASPGSCIWIHHMKDKGEMVENNGKKQWQPTGQYEMSGCEVVNEKVQVVIQVWREDLVEENKDTARRVKFSAQIVDSRHNADAMGEIFTDDNISFADIGTRIIAGSRKADWQ